MISPHFWSWLIVVLMFVFNIALPIVLFTSLVVAIPMLAVMSLAVLALGFSILVIVEQFRSGN